MGVMRDGELPAWPEVQRILDNEAVPLEQRQELALRYFSNVADESPADLLYDDPTGYGFNSDEQFEKIRKQYEDKLGVADQNPDADDDGDVMAAYTAAHETRDRLQQQQLDSLDKSIQGDRETLASLEASASDTSVSAANSDEILAHGKHVLDEIGLLNPVYGRAISVLGEGRRTYSMAELEEEYYEQSGIPFGKFAGAAEELSQLRGAVSDCWADQSGRMETVFANWGGAGKESARQSWHGIRGGKDEVESALRSSSEAIVRSTAAVAKSCRNKVGWMLEYRTSAEFGPAYPYFDLERLCDIAALARAASDNDLLHFVDRMPPNLATKIQDEAGDLEGEHKDAAAEWAKTVLRGFTKWFDQYLSDFQRMCDNEFNRVNSIWDKLNTALSEAPVDAFSGNAGAAEPNTTGGAGFGGPPGGAPSAPSAPSAGAAAVPAAAVGGGGAGGAGSAGQIPPAPVGTAPQSVGQPEGASPVTGEPLETDPETGEAVTEPGEEQEVVTVSHSDRTISLSEPDADGAMTVSIADGSGAPETFRLDFDTDTPWQPSDEQDTGSQGAEIGDSQIHRPDPDGVIRIEQEGATITAERPEGASGATLVTVDDGAGEPVTYTLGAETQPSDSDSDSAAVTEPVSAEPVSAEPEGNQQTSAQGWFGDVFGDSGSGVAAGIAGEAAEAPAFGDGARTDATASQEGTAGLGTAPGGGTAHSGSDGSDPASMRGMGMMGAGMAGAGAGGGGSDQERGPSGFLVENDLFDVGDSAVRISGTLGELTDEEAEQAPTPAEGQ